MWLPLCLVLVATTTANPVLINEAKPIGAASLMYAVDFSQVATQAQFTCLVGSAGYRSAFVRAYSPAGQGVFDSNSVTNIYNAYYAGFGGLEVYMTPRPTGSKSGATQLTETYNGLTSAQITVGQVWLQVTSPNQWSTSHNSNINFIQSYMNQLRVLGLSGGIYTSQSDWSAITGNWNGASSLPLWYYRVWGSGFSGESPPTYNDFVPFGGWYAPVAKQFAQVEATCGISPMNRDVYTDNGLVKKTLAKSNTHPVVGGSIKH